MINQATLLGRVGKIETRTSSAGSKFTTLSMVTDKKFTKDGQKQQKITWHNVIIFGKLAEIAEQWVTVGQLLYIQGELDNQKYTDPQGQEKTRSVIIAQDLKMMPRTKEAPKAPIQKDFSADFQQDEIPF